MSCSLLRTQLVSSNDFDLKAKEALKSMCVIQWLILGLRILRSCAISNPHTSVQAATSHLISYFHSTLRTTVISIVYRSHVRLESLLTGKTNLDGLPALFQVSAGEILKFWKCFSDIAPIQIFGEKTGCRQSAKPSWSDVKELLGYFSLKGECLLLSDLI